MCVLECVCVCARVRWELEGAALNGSSGPFAWFHVTHFLAFLFTEELHFHMHWKRSAPQPLPHEMLHLVLDCAIAFQT